MTNPIGPAEAVAAAEAHAKDMYARWLDDKVSQINAALRVCRLYPHAAYICQSNEMQAAEAVAAIFAKAGWAVGVDTRANGNVSVVLSPPKPKPDGGPYR